MKDKLLKILHLFILLLITIVIVASFYLHRSLGDTNFEELMFYSVSKIGNADLSTFFTALKLCLPFLIIIAVILYALFYDITFGKKQTKFYPFKHLNKHRWLYTMILLIISLTMLLNSVKVFDYITSNLKKSNFIADHYVNPKDVNITFPDTKRNLIIITVESLEYSFFTKEQGGAWDYEIIPELHELLHDSDAVTFNNNKGMYMIQGASFTTGSIVTNESGVPLKIGFNRKGYSNQDFMSGSYTLGDLLKDNGYNNEIISGATTSYGGLDYYYKQHGSYNIIDLDRIKNYNYNVTSDDYGKWGLNDNFTFKFAKQRLDTLASQDKPFNLEIVTIDTHFTDGYVGSYSETKFDKQYENAYATTSRLIYDFISYVKEQPYYDNTTILIVGDHLAMQTDFINNDMFDDRTVYFCIINPVSKEKYYSNRTFTALDTYPTIIKAIGGKVNNNKLGLGVNLFSKEKTLAEKYGVTKLNNELKKKSKFYNKVVLELR